MRPLLLLPALLLASLAVPAVSAQATFTVNTTADTPDVAIDGICDADGTAPGEQCTLRAALQETEATPAADSIAFDVPGAGVRTITVTGTALPALFRPVVIDGYSQPGASPNTNGPGQGTNAVIRIELVNGGGISRGLGFCFGDKTVRGLAIGGFDTNGITIDCTGTTGHVVEGCFIGTDAGGTVARPNGGNGVSLEASSSNRVGGTTPAARNVLSGNGRFGVGIGTAGAGQPSFSNVIQGNLIGTDASGTVALPNGTSFPGQLGGVGITPNQGAVSGNLIGGPTPEARNVISGNVGAGVLLQGSDLRVEGNFIGTDVTGNAPLPNMGAGLSVSSSATTVGGTEAGTANRIAHNGSAGISIPGLNTGVRVLGNEVFGNTGLGIDLAFLGGTPLANDAGDPDTGANLQQNTPVLSDAGLSGAGDLAVTYAVDTDPANATYPLRIEFFRADADDEGAAFLGADTYTAGDFGGCGTPPCAKMATFAPAAPVTSADAVVATATDDAGNTSEFTATPAVVVTSEGGPEAPAAFALHEATPNPFSSRTALRYEVAEVGHVRLAVYDLLGREVAVLVDGPREADRHEAVLDGARFPAGIYLVRMTTEGGLTHTRRVTLLR
jgi:hypothetical protein